jgi:hypothetical protein
MAEDSWTRLGILAAGMPAAREDAYRKRLADNLTLGQRGTSLTRDRMEIEGLEGLGDALIAAGLVPEQAEVVKRNAYGKSGSDFSASMQGLGHHQEQRFREKGVEAAAGGDWNLANAFGFGFGSGPQELATIQGDVLLGNRFLAGGDMRGPTAVGQARIKDEEASAVRNLASAANYYDAAEKRVPGGSAGSGGGTFTAPTEASLKMAFGKAGTDQYGNATAATVDPVLYSDFQEWRQANPQFRSGEEALVQYMNAKGTGQGGSPKVQFIDGLPGSSTKAPPTRMPAGIQMERNAETEAMERELGRKLADWELYEIAQGTFATTAPVGQGVGDTWLSGGAAPTATSTQPQSTNVQTRIAQARKALADGKDPQAVRKMLGQMGIDPSAAGL